MHVLSADQFTPDQLDSLFESASTMTRVHANVESRRELAATHVGKQLCSLFYEPSTRTRLSFEAAAMKLGMGVISTENAHEFSSVSKGETLEDTIRVIDEYAFDAIVLRHNETGAAGRAASVSSTPIINAGDGKGEHPTQALLDAYTIQKKFGKLSGLHVVMGGDLANGRTVRSLTRILGQYADNRLTFVSIPELQMGEDITASLDNMGVSYAETADMHGAITDADVIYWTRLQKERQEKSKAVTNAGFVIDISTLKAIPEHAIIMHPLPRTDEIDPSIDGDSRAHYFKQAGNGLFVRMALLDWVLADSNK